MLTVGEQKQAGQQRESVDGKEIGSAGPGERKDQAARNMTADGQEENTPHLPCWLFRNLFTLTLREI